MKTQATAFRYDSIALEIKTMKKINVCIILIIFATFTLPAEESDVILQA
jgi:hypothetical protein